MDQQEPRVDKYLSSRAKNPDSQREPIMVRLAYLVKRDFRIIDFRRYCSRWRHMTPLRRPAEKTTSREMRRWEGREGTGRELCARRKEVHTAHPSGFFVLSSSSSPSRAVLEPSLLPCHWRVDRVKDEEEDGCEVDNRARREREGQLCRFCDGPPQLPATRKCGRDSHSRSGATNSRASSSSSTWTRHRFLRWKIYRGISNNQ